MKESYEYQIFIGCRDSQTHEELVSAVELKRLITGFFERKKMDFSLISLRGGYLYEDGWYDTENTICISIVGDAGLDIIKISKIISDFMNQKCFLIVRNKLDKKFC